MPSIRPSYRNVDCERGARDAPPLAAERPGAEAVAGGLLPGRCHFLSGGERLERKVVAGRGEGRLEVTAEKHLVPVAFNVRQRAVVVVIGLLRLATI